MEKANHRLVIWLRDFKLAIKLSRHESNPCTWRKHATLYTTNMCRAKCSPNGITLKSALQIIPVLWRYPSPTYKIISQPGLTGRVPQDCSKARNKHSLHGPQHIFPGIIESSASVLWAGRRRHLLKKQMCTLIWLHYTRCKHRRLYTIIGCDHQPTTGSLVFIEQA